ncbi:unnamed protein product [Sphenostylis stenocarpa]|uniref:Uncharacterized protein n=1 Tax=Sphenostylis stenocarpa TaxID=92480 RepID=A0AA86S6S0_9FABA|nr:unnamed protein product [Sphenostylis stenocarpa]
MIFKEHSYSSKDSQNVNLKQPAGIRTLLGIRLCNEIEITEKRLRAKVRPDPFALHSLVLYTNNWENYDPPSVTQKDLLSKLPYNFTQGNVHLPPSENIQ